MCVCLSKGLCDQLPISPCIKVSQVNLIYSGMQLCSARVHSRPCCVAICYAKPGGSTWLQIAQCAASLEINKHTGTGLI